MQQQREQQEALEEEEVVVVVVVRGRGVTQAPAIARPALVPAHAPFPSPSPEVPARRRCRRCAGPEVGRAWAASGGSTGNGRGRAC